mmetsp:Transcript_72395/g.228776  ORF Transcript_72395/g.228776 Transcript_72395/m.228776 type:complete len:473 (-) Transcript_72395:397-1815(-)
MPSPRCVDGAPALHQLRQADPHPVGVEVGALGPRGAGARAARGGGHAHGRGHDGGLHVQVRRALRPPLLDAALYRLHGLQRAQAVAGVLVRAAISANAARVRRPSAAEATARWHHGHPRHGDVDALLARPLLAHLLGLGVVEQLEDVTVGPTDVLRRPRHPRHKLLPLPVAPLGGRWLILDPVVSHVLVLVWNSAAALLRLRRGSFVRAALGQASTGGCIAGAPLRAVGLRRTAPVRLWRARGRAPPAALHAGALGLVRGGHAGGIQHALLAAGGQLEGRARQGLFVAAKRPTEGGVCLAGTGYPEIWTADRALRGGARPNTLCVCSAHLAPQQVPDCLKLGPVLPLPPWRCRSRLWRLAPLRRSLRAWILPVQAGSPGPLCPLLPRGAWRAEPRPGLVAAEGQRLVRIPCELLGGLELLLPLHKGFHVREGVWRSTRHEKLPLQKLGQRPLDDGSGGLNHGLVHDLRRQPL